MDPHFCRHADASLGPVIPAGCRMASGESFDFTLLFEQVALTIVPCGLFLTGALLRIQHLHEARRVCEVDWKHQAKLTVASFYALLKAALLVLLCLPASGLLSGASVTSAVFALLVAVTLPAVSHYEHTRAADPSNLLGAYLNFTFIFDAAIARTLWLTQTSAQLPAVFTAALAVKGALMLLEACVKTPLTAARGKASPPESLGSVYFQGFFGWTTPLVRSRSRGAIDLEDLEALDGASEKSARPLASKV
ncbi:P-loop containing nucleoside triphosphate hydrolase protein [Apiospora saccharicola]|uniref:P-loop containing nucleoside triphosphate hydrolase protein n=1 Tax=Apiospora saccharicola TaxID=335842 RepID=A0ABR1U4F0_9PEZI